MKATAGHMRRKIVASLAIGLGLGSGVILGLLAGNNSIPPFPSSPVGYADVAARVQPWVVSITSQYEAFLQRSRPIRELPGISGSREVGSGIIVDARQGLVLTNNHLVDRANKIFVTLWNGTTCRGDVVGTDPETDLAVLRLRSPPSLPAQATFADSDRVRRGDLVLAFGSPLGLDFTVTSGIVSGLGRRALLTIYEDYIQTDAPIYPGNSGGPLVNLEGQVIGIVSAMLADPGRSRSAGMGLAIPSNLARWVKDRILRDGRVRRGYLGIRAQTIDDALAAAFHFESVADLRRQMGLDQVGGAMITEVLRGYPCAEAGLQVGDVISRFDGQSVPDAAWLLYKMCWTEPGAVVRLGIKSSGRPEREIEIRMAERPQLVK